MIENQFKFGNKITLYNIRDTRNSQNSKEFGYLIMTKKEMKTGKAPLKDIDAYIKSHEDEILHKHIYK